MQYMSEHFRNFALLQSIPGVGTDNNAHERYNRTTKQIHSARASLAKFLSTSIQEIFTNVGLCYSGKLNGNPVTDGNRDNIPLLKFIVEYQVSPNLNYTYLVEKINSDF